MLLAKVTGTIRMSPPRPWSNVPLSLLVLRPCRYAIIPGQPGWRRSRLLRSPSSLFCAQPLEPAKQPVPPNIVIAVPIGVGSTCVGMRANGQRTFASDRRQRKEIPDLRTSTATLRGFPPRRLWIDRAGMFDLGMRQKDMIGEWVPRSEPGVTDVFSGGSKWLMSARWEEIDEQFVWKHRLSKSVTREGIMELETGKTELFETLEFPPSCQRAHPGRPFCRFRDRSRKIARARAEHRERVANGIANK
jgi:plasmid stabilization system protein ParE